MTELVQAIASWQTLLLLVVVFGFAPGFVLRLLVTIYPREDPRRRELVAQLYALGRIERLFFVCEQLETVLFEGVPLRVKAGWSRSLGWNGWRRLATRLAMIAVVAALWLLDRFPGDTQEPVWWDAAANPSNTHFWLY